jgi:hypothetical protein
VRVCVGVRARVRACARVCKRVSVCVRARARARVYTCVHVLRVGLALAMQVSECWFFPGFSDRHDLNSDAPGLLSDRCSYSFGSHSVGILAIISRAAAR